MPSLKGCYYDKGNVHKVFLVPEAKSHIREKLLFIITIQMLGLYISQGQIKCRKDVKIPDY